MTILADASPEKVGLSSERLDRIASWMCRQVDNGRLAGLEVMIVRRGCTAFHRCEGLADIARNKAATPETLYRLYSMSKPLTSIAIMMLYEEKHFQLDDPISSFLPEFAGQRVWLGDGHDTTQSKPALRDITIRDLLTHTSGLTYGFMQANAVDAMYRQQKLDALGSELSLADFVNKVARLPLIAQPGSRWNYSVSTDVLARLVEIISGSRFDLFLTDRVLKPIGMLDTTFRVPAEKVPRLAACYVRGSDGRPQLLDDPPVSNFVNSALPPFGGALVSTASDYMRFCQTILAEGAAGSTRLLDRKTVELMTTNHLGGDMAAMGQPRFAESNCHGVGFGLGFSILLDPTKAQTYGTPGECGWGGIASTAFWIDPREELAAVLMTQLVPSSQYPLRQELRSVVSAAIVD